MDVQYMRSEQEILKPLKIARSNQICWKSGLFVDDARESGTSGLWRRK